MAKKKKDEEEYKEFAKKRKGIQKQNVKTLKQEKKEEIPKHKVPKKEKLSRKQAKHHTAKKGGPETIIGYPSKKGKGPHKVEYPNTPKNRRKHLDKNIG